MPLNESNPLLLTLVGYLLPFVGFYLGIVIRIVLRKNLFRQDVLSTSELCVAGILFAILAVAPLLPAFQSAIDDQSVDTYLLTLAVVIQAGLFMPESLGRVMRRRGAGAASTPAAGSA